MEWDVVLSLIVGFVFGCVFTMVAAAYLMKSLERIGKDIEREKRLAREFDYDEDLR